MQIKKSIERVVLLTITATLGALLVFSQIALIDSRIRENDMKNISDLISKSVRDAIRTVQEASYRMSDLQRKNEKLHDAIVPCLYAGCYVTADLEVDENRTFHRSVILSPKSADWWKMKYVEYYLDDL